jgi:PIN domain nuclease of toxin-antitoxin system
VIRALAAGHPRFAVVARGRSFSLRDRSKFVSAASAWEIGTKVRLGKLPGAEDLAADFAEFLAREHFEQLAITVEHGIRAGLLPGPHRDPFDRMLAAQGQTENLPLVTNDAIFDAYNIRRLW